jgi:hypothetical protein
MAITKEQIFAAADELDAAGQNPTLASRAQAARRRELHHHFRGDERVASTQGQPGCPDPRAGPGKPITDKLAELGGDLWAVALGNGEQPTGRRARGAGGRVRGDGGSAPGGRRAGRPAHRRAGRGQGPLRGPGGRRGGAKGEADALRDEAGRHASVRPRPRPAPASCARSWIMHTPTPPRSAPNLRRPRPMASG